MSESIPETQGAVELVGPNELRLNPSKPVPSPGPNQILVRTEAVGLCFSDMKLLKQFAEHPRKGPVVGGIDPSVLAGLPSYRPDDQPTVPGHELCVRVVAVGEGVADYEVGSRWLVQPDFRTLRTQSSNAACGYNFEGGLQEYVLFDQRILGRPDEEGAYMIPAPEGRSASSVGLVEPWACVENSYVTEERRGLLSDGKLLVVAPEGFDRGRIERLGRKPDAFLEEGFGADWLPNEAFDDIVYFGRNPRVIEALNDKLAPRGIANIVLGGGRIGRPVTIGVGRIHYGYTRWVGTVGNDPLESYRTIPATGEVRARDRMLVMGAGGPMGQMHTIRALSLGLPDLEVVASDVDPERLAGLAAKASSLGARLRTVDPSASDPGGGYTYVALMAPVPDLLVDGLARCGDGAIFNMFAGIPMPVKHPIDLDALIQKRVFLFGTSGSDTRDMRLVLDKLVRGALDTDMSVSAVSGMAGAIVGLRAVDERSIDGKILVYPALRKLGLIPLKNLPDVLPSVAEKLSQGAWCLEAERELLRVAVG